MGSTNVEFRLHLFVFFFFIWNV